MNRWSTILMLALGAAVAYGAEESLEAHAGHPSHTIILDKQDIRPSTTTMSKDDVIVFENQSLQAIKVTFTDPTDMRDKILCHIVRGKESERPQAPWQLFAWTDGKLVATIPPGRFASVCSLAPGSYSFVTERQGVRPHQGAAGELPEKGQIVVN